MTPVEVTRGDGPVILGIPHAGTWLPEAVLAGLNATGRARADTDWHVDRLYDGLLPGATVVSANFHRYLIDANRSSDDTSLYPGQNTTGLCPLTDFDGRPIHLAGHAPDAGEIALRRAAWHGRYHAALAAEIERVKRRHGVVVLYDCHSIRSRIPYLFEGTLPDFSIGTGNGNSCDPRIEAKVLEICNQAAGYSHVLNGRFKGGWTTRHYGWPRLGLHAIQMELAQSTYLAAEAAPWEYDPERAARLRPHLARILTTLAALAPTLGAAHA